MLTDAALKALKPKGKVYKVSDRDGMYARVTPTGLISFSLDYRLNGRRETVYLGRYGRDGISLARARELCLDAKRAVREGRSPAIEKQREKRRLKEAKSFGQFGEKWLDKAPMADSTRAMRRSIFDRELLPVWRNRLLREITPDDLRALCAKIVDRGAPATAIHVRDILKQIYSFAILHGEKVPNPADEVGPASIAAFRPREGIETILSLRQLLPQMPMAAALSAGHLAAFLFPAHLRRLYIVRDNDPAGDSARDKLVVRTQAAGLETITLSPMMGDFNEDLTSCGLDALRVRLHGQLAADDVSRFMALAA